MATLDYSLTRTTEPTAEPLTIDAAKRHLREPSDMQDELIGELITAAREQFEADSWRACMEQVWQLSLDAFCNEIELPQPAPVANVDSFEYNDGNSLVAVDPATYGVDLASTPALVYLQPGQSWPNNLAQGRRGVVLTYTAGVEARDDVPKRYRQAILLLVGHWYENREAVAPGNMSEVPLAYQRLIDSIGMPDLR